MLKKPQRKVLKPASSDPEADKECKLVFLSGAFSAMFLKQAAQTSKMTKRSLLLTTKLEVGCSANDGATAVDS